MPARTNRSQEFFDEFLLLSQAAIEEAASDLPGPARAQLAERILCAFCDTWGGMHVYVPFDLQRRREARDKEILATFDGTTATTVKLAKRFNLSTATIHKICRDA